MQDKSYSSSELFPLIAAVALPLIPIVSQAGVLAALPLLALMIPLLFGRYLGESVIERLASRPAVPPRHQRRRSGSRPRPAAVRTLLRNELLIATSFAKRPPPLGLAFS